MSPSDLETTRRASLRSLAGPGPGLRDPAFDALVEAASVVCGCPIALISLDDGVRQCFAAGVGWTVRETPRDHWFCTDALDTATFAEVPDVAGDERFADHPFVVGDPRVRFYAAQTLVARGCAVGTLCVIDRVPRTLTTEQRAVLERLATAAAALLERRMDAFESHQEACRLGEFAMLSGDWLWETDATGRCAWLSAGADAAIDLFDGARMRDAALLDAAGRALPGPTLLDLLGKGSAFVEAIIEVATGPVPRYLAVTARPIASGHGGHRGSVRDVTARVQAERTVSARGDVLRKIAAQVPGMIYQYRRFADGRSCFPYASEGIRWIYGVEPEDVQHHAAIVSARIHPDDREAVERSIEASIADGSHWNARYRVCLPERGVRWLQGSSSPERLGDGSTLWHGIITDVTDSQARDRELADTHAAVLAAERRLRAVTDHLPALVVRVDRDERYTFVNAHVGRVFGAAGQGLVGRTMREVRGEEQYARLRPHLEVAFAGGVASFDGAETIGGRCYHFQAVCVPDIDEAGTVVGIYVMTFDVTKRKEAELRLAASEKRLRDIADNLPALLCYVDRNDVYHFANATYAKWMGVDHRTMVGRTVKEIFPPAAYSVVSAYAERARAGERLSFERSEMRDGREVHYRVEMIPDHGPDGAVLGVYAMTTDVTERYEAGLRLARSEQRLLDITNNIPAVIGVFDLEDRCVFSNDVGLRVIGVERSQLPSVTFRSHLEPYVYAQHAAALAEVHVGRRAVAHCRHQVAGETRWFEAHLVPAMEDGRQYGFFSMSFDVTTLKNAEAARASSEARLRQITDNLPVLISHFDAEERLTYVNETFRLWIGTGDADLIGRRLRDTIGPDRYAQRKPYIDRCLAGEQVTFEIESLFTTGTRSLQTTYLPDFRPDGGIAGMTTLSIDVTDLKDAERRLSLLAHSDALTGLPNRLQFDGRLVEMLARDASPECIDAVMFLDVDHFKHINDTHGHATGDAVLQRFAQRVKRSVRSTDFVARLAGDEFVVLLYGLRDAAEAGDIGRKVVEQAGRPLRINGKAIGLTASVGVAVRDADTRTPADLLARADEALYRAKAAGRNTVRLAA